MTHESEFYQIACQSLIGGFGIIFAWYCVIEPVLWKLHQIGMVKYKPRRRR